MTLLWAAAMMTALLWPSRSLSMLGGAPLDGRLEAVLIGLAVPLLCWLHPRFLSNALARLAIVLLLVVKLGASLLLTQQGLCATFSTAAPYTTNVLTIPIEEPGGWLRSWDIRADWHAASPRCTAIVGRPYADASAFPAWFVNITDFATAGKRRIAMDVRGYSRAGERGLLVLDSGGDMTISGRIGSNVISSSDGKPILVALDAGTQPWDLHVTLTGDRWRLVPTWNGRDAFRAMSFSVDQLRTLDRGAALFSIGGAALTMILIAGWLISIAVEYRTSPLLLTWCLAASAAFTAIGTTGRFERVAVLALAAALLVPVAERHRHVRGAVLLVGVPWMALIAARSLPQIAHFTAYSNDDWLAYQAAGYRIFMHGFWLEGGSKVFDYQPLYRWISGGLHLAFGDSSVGEVYWDAICLLLGGCVGFAVVNRAAGFRWALAAFVGTLATYWLGTIWYFVGRGLSEVAAAGWAFIAALILMEEGGTTRTAALAGLFAVLMFYTRLNHLLFAFFLVALMTPFYFRPAAAYIATFVSGVLFFAARTWWYTGHFSVLYGTSLKNNDTGLRLATVASPEVWGKIWHSLRALVWMNEPPSPDSRAALVVTGAVLSIAVLLRLPKFNRLPFGLAVVIAGACVSSLFAHTHNYPGRMSVHLAPFAVAMTMTAGAKLLAR